MMSLTGPPDIAVRVDLCDNMGGTAEISAPIFGAVFVFLDSGIGAFLIFLEGEVR